MNWINPLAPAPINESSGTGDMVGTVRSLVKNSPPSETGCELRLQSSNQSGPSGLEAIHSFSFKPATVSIAAAVLNVPGVATLSAHDPEPSGTRPTEKSGICRPKVTESMSPPPLVRLLNRKRVPPLAPRAKPVLLVLTDDLSSQKPTRKPWAGIVVPGTKMNLRAAFGSSL